MATSSPIRWKLIELAVRGVQSVCWDGDVLVDWVGGGLRVDLSGRVEPAHVVFSYRFDEAVISPSGRFSVIYERVGTKGLVLREGHVLREINRSYYHADDYIYPVTLFRLDDGREVIAHCPDEYNRLEIDELGTGRRLTRSDQRKPADVFHSRLAVSPSGRYLLSAGWVWHPVDVVEVYDINAALKDPTHLDSDGTGPVPRACSDVTGAAFLPGDRLVTGTSSAGSAPIGVDPRQGPSRLEVFDLAGRSLVSSATTVGLHGRLMPIGLRHVVAFYDHPRLIELRTGEAIDQWPQMDSGREASSIVQDAKLPPLAIDAERRRFAVADKDCVRVVTFE